MMNSLSILETLHKMDMSLAALLFNLLLWAMVELQGFRKNEEGNRAFCNLTLFILLANMVSCAATFVRFADIDIPVAVISLMQLCAYMANTLVVYFFSVYIITYFSRIGEKKVHVPRINTLLVFAEAAILLIYFLWVCPKMMEDGIYRMPTGWLFLIVGFAMELYHLFYCVIFFLRRRDTLDNRSRVVIVSAFGITISSIIAQGFIGPIPLINYLGATLGLMIFYFNAETPDYHKLLLTMKELEEERKRSDAAYESMSKVLKEIVEAPYSLSDVLKEVSDIIRPRAEAKGLQFKLDVDGSIPDALYGDDVRLRQALINVLNNSVQATGKGSILVSVREKEREDDVTNLIFWVEDTGIKDREPDAITPQIVEQMNGRINAGSVFGEGSVFTIMLPQKVLGEETVGASFAARKADSPARQFYEEIEETAASVEKLLAENDYNELMHCLQELAAEATLAGESDIAETAAQLRALAKAAEGV